MKKLNLLSLIITLALVAGFALSPVAESAVMFDPTSDSLNNPTVVDDFSDGTLDKWDNGDDANVTIKTRDDGGKHLHYVRDVDKAGVTLNTDLIPLPDDGEMMVVDIRASGDFDNRPEIELTNNDGNSFAEVSNGGGTYFNARAKSSQTASPLTKVATETGETEFETFRFVYDNTAGNREVSIFHAEPNSSTFSALEWDSGGAVTATDAWDTSDPLEVHFDQNEGGTAFLAMDSVQYQTITVVDDFSDDNYNKWTIGGPNAVASIETRGDGGKHLYLDGNSSATLNTDFIPLPDDGEQLVVDLRVSGRFDLRPELRLTNNDGTASAVVSNEMGDYLKAKAKGSQTVSPLTKAAEQVAETEFETYRFLYDNTAGNREVSIFHAEHGDSTFSALEWDSGGDVTATDAWSDPDAPLEIKFASNEGGYSWVAMDSVQYQTNPGSPVEIVANDEARAIVVTAAEPTPTVTYAVEELVNHIEKATGVQLPVAREDDIPETPQGRIYIGNTKAARAVGIDVKNLGPDTFALKTDGNRVFIAGEESAEADPLDLGRSLYSGDTGANPYGGPLFGVYELLERELGVRWLWPGELGTYIPRTDNVTVTPADQVIDPKFDFRRFRLGYRIRDHFSAPDGTDFSDYANDTVQTMSGINDRDIYARDLVKYARRHRQGFSRHTPTAGHGSEGVKWERHGGEHPEWFAMNAEGERVGPHLCVSNKELWHFIVEEQWDGGRRLSLGIPDKSGYCHCDKCLSWDSSDQRDYTEAGKRYIVSDRYARFWKGVYDLAVERNPDVQIPVLQYYNTFCAPRETIDLNENIIGYFTPWGWPAHESNQWLASITTVYSGGNWGWIKGKQREQWLGWRDTGISLIYRPNAWHAGYVMPRHVTTQPPPFFKFAYENGMIAFDYDSLFGYWVTRGPELYLHYRWGAHPEEKMDEVLQGYFEAFGPASGQVKSSFDYWGDYQPPADHDKARLHGGNILNPHELFPPEAFNQPLALLDDGLQAANQAERPVFAERVEFLIAGVKHAQLTSQFWSTLAFKDGRNCVPENPAEEEITRQALRDLLVFRHEHRDMYIADFVHAAQKEDTYIDGLSELCQSISQEFWTLSILSSDGEGLTDPAAGDYKYEFGNDAQVTATPAENWKFAHWLLDGEDAGTDNPITVASGSSGDTRTIRAVFEKKTTGSGIPYSWLEEHGLPTDGSKDHERIGDSQFTVLEEWIAGTDPNDITDNLRMTEPPVETADGFKVRWQSVPDRTYTIERSEDLTGESPFEPLATGVQGVDGIAEYVDETAEGDGPFFYRVVVE